MLCRALGVGSPLRTFVVLIRPREDELPRDNCGEQNACVRGPVGHAYACKIERPAARRSGDILDRDFAPYRVMAPQLNFRTRHTDSLKPALDLLFLCLYLIPLVVDRSGNPTQTGAQGEDSRRRSSSSDGPRKGREEHGGEPHDRGPREERSGPRVSHRLRQRPKTDARGELRHRSPGKVGGGDGCRLRAGKSITGGAGGT